MCDLHCPQNCDSKLDLKQTEKVLECECTCHSTLTNARHIHDARDRVHMAELIAVFYNYTN